MRGRKPKTLKIPPTERISLQWIARNISLPDYQRERAQMVLALADGARVQEIAERFACVGSTVWRIGRRYERGGLSRLLADGRRQKGARPFGNEPMIGQAFAGCAG